MIHQLQRLGVTDDRSFFVGTDLAARTYLAYSSDPRWGWYVAQTPGSVAINAQGAPRPTKVFSAGSPECDLATAAAWMMEHFGLADLARTPFDAGSVTSSSSPGVSPSSWPSPPDGSQPRACGRGHVAT